MAPFASVARERAICTALCMFALVFKARTFAREAMEDFNRSRARHSLVAIVAIVMASPLSKHWFFPFLEVPIAGH